MFDVYFIKEGSFIKLIYKFSSLKMEYLMDSFNGCYENAARYSQKTVFQIKNEIVYNITKVY